MQLTYPTVAVDGHHLPSSMERSAIIRSYHILFPKGDPYLSIPTIISLNSIRQREFQLAEFEKSFH